VGLALAGAAWFPVSNLPFPIEIMMAERFLYLPMAGLALAAAGALPDLALSGRAVRIGGAAVLAALLVALGLRSMVRAADWRDPATLAASAERAYPRSARAEVYAAQQAVGRGDVRGAAAAYQRAIAIWPGLALWYADLAPLLHELGDLEGAMAAARHATELAPDDPVGWYNLGVELESAGRLREARETFCTGAAHAPDDVPLREACPAP
jgi:tetratricopeptide (TPR) repeat protein